jgi:hypothetical protein
MADLTQFEIGSARRIARVVRQVEQEPRRAKALSFSAVETPAKQKPFRICTFTGAWSKNSFKAVTFKYQTTTPNTVSATNLFANIAQPAAAANCAIAKEGTAWFLIAAEC